MANHYVDVSVVLFDYVKAVRIMSKLESMPDKLPTFRIWLQHYLNKGIRETKYGMSQEEYEDMMQWDIRFEDVKNVDDLQKADDYLITNEFAVKMPDYLQSELTLKTSKCSCGHEHQPTPIETLKCSQCDSCRFHYFKERIEKENGHQVNS